MIKQLKSNKLVSLKFTHFQFRQVLYASLQPHKKSNTTLVLRRHYLISLMFVHFSGIYLSVKFISTICKFKQVHAIN